MADKKLLAVGVFWNGVQLTINQSFSFIVKLVLAKLLFPEQFGVVGMATVFTGFIQILNDLGIGSALVQRKKKTLSALHLQTAFWTGLIWSIILFLFMSLLVGPLAATFYGEPILRKIIPVLSLGILFGSLNLVHKAQLIRQMNFKRMAFIDSTARIFSGCIAILLAVLGAGVWSLVLNSVFAFLLSVPFYFHATGWWPKLQWGNLEFKEIFAFGAFTSGSNILSYVYNNIDYLLIGKLLGSSALGAYSLAFVLTDVFRSKIMNVINRVIYPFYGKNQQNPHVLKKYYLKVVQFNCLIIYPIMVFFCVLGRPFLLGFFGEKWVGTVLPLQILSVAVMFHMIVSGNSTLLRGLGRPGLEMRLQLLKAAIFIPTLLLGIWFFGTVGAACAVLINKIISVIIAQLVFKKFLTVKINYTELWEVLKHPMIAALISFLLTYTVRQMGGHYIVGAAVLFLSYLSVVWYLMKGEFKILWKQIKPA